MFNEQFDDSVESDDPSMDNAAKRLNRVFKVTRRWLLEGNRSVFKVLSENDDSIALFFTPIS